MSVKEIKEALLFLAVEEKRLFFPRYFKAGKGEYAEGDQFLGVSVPDQRKVAKAYSLALSDYELSELLQSPIHEHRLTALFILVSKFERAKEQKQKEAWVKFYLDHLSFVNNWDLVDSSCYKILGVYCYENGKEDLLWELAKADHLWSNRIAIVSTMHYIKKGHLALTEQIALFNLSHPHDLMHKANGWLLREMGKKDPQSLLNFLELHYQKMPRTTLRYAIEKLEEKDRQTYLAK